MNDLEWLLRENYGMNAKLNEELIRACERGDSAESIGYRIEENNYLIDSSYLSLLRMAVDDASSAEARDEDNVTV